MFAFPSAAVLPLVKPLPPREGQAHHTRSCCPAPENSRNLISNRKAFSTVVFGKLTMEFYALYHKLTALYMQVTQAGTALDWETTGQWGA